MKKVTQRILIGLAVTTAALYIAGAIYERRDFQRVFPVADRHITENPDSFILYSINPEGNPETRRENLPKSIPSFHDFPVLGAVPIKDAALQKDLMGQLYRQWRPGTDGAMCFNPRHGIRATKRGKTVDYLICFECSYVYVYRGKDAEPVVGTVTGGSELFNEILLRNKIRLPPQ